jgi:hypothetical protein
VSGFPQRLGGGSDARPHQQRHDRVMARELLFVSSFNSEAAFRAVPAPALDVDLAAISPSDAARETAGYAAGGCWASVCDRGARDGG